eukprot:5435154-Lingulodinium_polyedra.AAC.1
MGKVSLVDAAVQFAGRGSDGDHGWVVQFRKGFKGCCPTCNTPAQMETAFVGMRLPWRAFSSHWGP